jgi:hypothetical protein
MGFLNKLILLMMAVIVMSCLPENGQKKAECASDKTYNTKTRTCDVSKIKETFKPPVGTLTTLSMTEDTAKTVELTYSDVDDHPVQACFITAYNTRIDNTPPTCLCSSGKCYATITPDLNEYGTSDFTYSVSDPDGTSASRLVGITITGVNDTPALAASVQSFSTVEDITYTSVSTPLLSATDVEDVTLTPGSAVYELVSNVSNGTLTFVSNGSYTYVPTANYFGADSFTYRIRDNGYPSGSNILYSANITMSITVTAVNDAPTITSGASYAVTEDTLRSGTLTGSDIEGEVLTFSIITSSASGALTLNAATGAFTYMPNANFNAASAPYDSFVFRVCDASAACSANKTVSLIVSAANDLPLLCSAAGTPDQCTGVNTPQGCTGAATPSGYFISNTTVKDCASGVSHAAVAEGSGEVTFTLPYIDVDSVNNNATSCSVTVNAGSASLAYVSAACDCAGTPKVCTAGITPYNTSGLATISYTVTTSGGTSAIGSYSFTIVDVNDIPKVLAPTNVYKNEGGYIYAGPFTVDEGEDEAAEDTQALSIKVTSSNLSLIPYTSGSASSGMILYNSAADIVIDATNNKIDFDDADIGTYSVALAVATYNHLSLCAEIVTQMNAISSKDYKCEYLNTSKYKISTVDNSIFKLLWNTGTFAGTSAATVLGFVNSADATGASNYTSDRKVILLKYIADIDNTYQGLGDAGTDAAKYFYYLKIRPVRGITGTSTLSLEIQDSGAAESSQIQIKNNNSWIDFTDSSGTYSAQVPIGYYAPSVLATTLQGIMDPLSLANYLVTYNNTTHKFEIETDSATLALNFSTGSNANKSLASTLGYAATNYTAATLYTAPNAVYPVNSFNLTVYPIGATHGGWKNIKSVGAKVDKQAVTIAAGGVTLEWNEFSIVGTGALSTATNQGWKIYRRELGSDYDFSVPLNTSAIAPSVRAYTDSTATAGKVYFYIVRANDNVNFIDIATEEEYSEVRVVMPPNNSAFVHRWMANQEMCKLMHQDSLIDPLKNFRCPYRGPGEVLDAGSYYYDVGSDLLVDVGEVGCPYTAAPECTGNGCIGISVPSANVLDGSIFYNRSNGKCYVESGTATWTEIQLAGNSTTYLSKLANLPPLVNVTQAKAKSLCETRTQTVTGYVGATTYTLPSRKDQIIYSAWGQDQDDFDIATYETGLNINSSSKCNTSSANGLTGSYTDVSIPNSAALFSLPGSASSGIRSIYTSSTSDGQPLTPTCTSRYGVQDVVGNVSEWVAESFNCTSTTCDSANLLAGRYNLTVGGGDPFASYKLDGSRGPCVDADADGYCDSFFTDWAFDDEVFGANYMNLALGIPMHLNWATTYGGSSDVDEYFYEIGPTNGITTGQLHDDGIEFGLDEDVTSCTFHAVLNQCDTDGNGTLAETCSSAAVPTNNVTPAKAGLCYQNTLTGKFYFSTGATNTSWVAAKVQNFGCNFSQTECTGGVCSGNIAPNTFVEHDGPGVFYYDGVTHSCYVSTGAAGTKTWTPYTITPTSVNTSLAVGGDYTSVEKAGRYYMKLYNNDATNSRTGFRCVAPLNSGSYTADTNHTYSY